jgi:hypothetical protein
MQFLTIYKPDQGVTGTPPSPEQMAEMRAFAEESMKSGVLLNTGSFIADGKGSMRLKQGEFTIGGPSDSQTQMGGFAILKTEDEKQLQEVVKRFLTLAGDGTCEILRLFEMPQN